MKKDDQSPPKDDSSELVKFKRLAMRVVSVRKDAIFDLDAEAKIHKERKPETAANRKTRKRQKPQG